MSQKLMLWEYIQIWNLLMMFELETWKFMTRDMDHLLHMARSNMIIESCETFWSLVFQMLYWNRGLLFEVFEVCCIENLLFISFGDFKGCVVHKKLTMQLNWWYMKWCLTKQSFKRLNMFLFNFAIWNIDLSKVLIWYFVIGTCLSGGRN